VVVADPPVAPAAEAQRSGKPVVFVQANIHAGEVEGKEACLELLRDVVAGATPYPIEDIVWMVVPIYNADGNDRFGPENRPHQHGPDEMGVRTTARGLDLNRDYLKLENQEARDLVALIDEWDPHVHVDLHQRQRARLRAHLCAAALAVDASRSAAPARA
jgi:murein tripeptide amidase MpaA